LSFPFAGISTEQISNHLCDFFVCFVFGLFAGISCMGFAKKASTVDIPMISTPVNQLQL
jgi:hypothetical protein